MSSHVHSIGAMNFRRTVGILVIFAAMVAATLFSVGQVSAQETPTFLTATAGYQQVSLDWSDGSELDLTYNVYRSETAGGPYTALIASGLAVSEYVDAGLINGTTYYYVVTAVDADGNESVTSDEALATPQDLTPSAAPTLLTASSGDQQVSLDWSDGAELDSTFNVYRSEIAGGPYTVPIASGLTVSEYVDVGLINGTTYYYVVTAVDAALNESLNSNEASATPQDLVAPTITASVDPTANSGGWNNTDVTVTFICTVDDSGISACEGSQTLTAEGAGQSAEGTATDLEGNTATLIVSNINIDKTAPTVTITSPDQDAVLLPTDTVIAVWGASDGLSGIASSTGTVDSGEPIGISIQGINSFTVTATDLAGNTASVTHSYTVLVLFAVFDMDKGHLGLEQGAASDEFEVEGNLQAAENSNGIDVLNEAVTVTFDGFMETIPAGSFVRNEDDDGFEFIGASGGLTQVRIKDDGQFRVQGRGLDLGSIVTSDPVFLSLRIGDDVGQTNILFGTEPFKLEAREAKDLFGTVFSVTVLTAGQGVLVLNTRDGFIDVITDEDTEFTLPRNRNARIDDLVEGDLLAVSLEDKDGVLVADKVLLVPGKTKHRHIPGEIISLRRVEGTIEEITIQRPGAGAAEVTYNITGDTDIKGLPSIDALTVGLFVVVLTGEADALEIHVTRGRPPVGKKPPKPPKSQSKNTAKIKGVLQLDADGNWTINGIAVALDSDTEIEGGLVAGQVVKIEGILQADGTILASEVEGEDDDIVVSNKTKLEGIFQGIDPETGKWIISGTLVAVGPGTDTDGLPFEGQRVKVKALLQADGTLLAREIENKGGSVDGEDDSSEVKLKGTFRGVDADGRWIINGTPVLVDPLTRVQGTPTVGEQIEVNALLQVDGFLLAQKIKGHGRGKSRSSNKAKVRGIIDDILDDGTLIVDGVPISISVLTELDFDPQIGDSVKVEASLQPDGSLVASEVEGEDEPVTEDVQEPSKVEIEGTIERVNADGSLVVNGITVAISALSKIKGNLVEGATVKLEGLLQENGTLLALELKARGRRATASGTDRKIEGLVEAILRDPGGNIVEIVVDGQTISAEALTEFEGLLEIDAPVEVKGRIVDGRLVADKVEGKGDRGKSRAEAAREKGLARAEEAREKGRAKAEEARNKGQARAEEAREKGRANAEIARGEG